MERPSIYPIKYQELWDAYKNVESQFWTSKVANFSEDDFESLEPSQKEYLKMLLFFFANSDSVVADNIVLNFLSKEDLPPEAGFFYGFQVMIENVHNECYALLIQNYIKDPIEREKAFNSIEHFPVVGKKMAWAQKWLNGNSYEETLVAFIAVELILFSSTFAGIFGFKDLKKPLKALYTYNTEISRDEATHGHFGVLMYNKYTENKLSEARVREIILEAYEVERVFVEDCFGEGVIGFSKEKMLDYIKFVTDNVLSFLNLEPEFGVTQCPLKYMENIALAARENFFEGDRTEYTKLGETEIGLTDDY